MKTSVSIIGNETIEELVNKVSLIDCMEDKLIFCLLIIGFLERKNNIPPKSVEKILSTYQDYIVYQSKQKHTPTDPKVRHRQEILFGVDENRDIKDFIYYFKKIDPVCYKKFENYLEEKFNKVSGKSEIIGWVALICLFVLLYFLLSFL